MKDQFSKRFKIILLTTVILFIAHGLEEYTQGFYNVDSSSRFVFGYFESLPVSQAIFLLFQVMWWLVLVVILLFMSGYKWQVHLMMVLGLIFVFELHHILKAVIGKSYYPGLVTALLFPVVGFFFWRELLEHGRNAK